MNTMALIIGMAVCVYLLRSAGFLLAGVAVPASWERALGFVPIATLTALVVSSLAGRPDEAPIRLTAATGAVLLAWRTGRPWVCILGGMLLYSLLRVVS